MPPHPVAPPAERLHHLLEPRVHRKRRPRAAQRRRQQLRQQRTGGRRLEQHRAVVILHGGARRAARPVPCPCAIELLPHGIRRRQLRRTIRVDGQKIVHRHAVGGLRAQAGLDRRQAAAGANLRSFGGDQIGRRVNQVIGHARIVELGIIFQHRGDRSWPPLPSFAKSNPARRAARPSPPAAPAQNRRPSARWPGCAAPPAYCEKESSASL